MKIISAQLFVYYETDDSLRKKLFDLEGKLHEDFITPFPIVRNIPDGANETLPRFETTSLNGNSELKISPTFIQFSTTFTNDYQIDVTKIEKYYDEKFSLLTSILENNVITFYGFLIDLEEEFKDENDVLSTIRTHFPANIVNDKTIAISLTYSRLVNGHYCNVKVEKYTLFQGKIEIDKNKLPIPIPEPEQHGVRTQLDINSKPKYRDGTKSNLSEIKTLIHKALYYAIEHDSESYLSGSIDFEPIVSSSNASD